jgi:hypothetical protein
MRETSSLPSSPSLGLTNRLVVYVLWWFVLALLMTPLADADWGGFGGKSLLYRVGLAAWSSHVLILVAVLILSVRSLVVAFQLALLASLLQGYFYMTAAFLWAGDSLGTGWESQIQFTVVLGLTAALTAIVWLLVRVVGKLGLSPEALERSGRSGQLGLREMLYIMASLSALMAVVSLFSFPGVIPVEQVLAKTVLYAGQVGPLTLAPFWLTSYHRIEWRHCLWLVPLTLLYAGLCTWLDDYHVWLPWLSATGTFLGIVFGTTAAIAANAIVQRLLGLTWRQGGCIAPEADSSSV